MFSELVTVLAAPFLLSLVTAAASVPVVLPQDASYSNNVINQIAGGNFVSDPTVGAVLPAVGGHVICFVEGDVPVQCACHDDIDNDGDGLIDCSDDGCQAIPGDPASCVPTNNLEQEPIPPPEPEPGPGGGGLSIQVIRTQCSGPLLTYRIIITNNGDLPAANITIIDTHPNMPVANIQRAPDEYSEIERKIVWREGGLQPGASLEYSFDVPHIIDHVENRVVIKFSLVQADGTAVEQADIVHYELISDACGPDIEGEEPPEFPTAPLSDKKPAIICNPKDTTCAEAIPKLGINFDNAVHYEFNPTYERVVGLPLGIQKNTEEIKPELGVRFEFANSTPFPGDCRVISEDEIPGYRFLPDVQVTWCESGEYPELLIRGAPEPVKAKFGAIRLPDTRAIIGEPPGSITKADEGVACRGLPGDPWWAADCSCQCGDFIFAPAKDDGADAFLEEAFEQGIVVPCGAANTAQITRHDIYVTSQAECLNDPGHEDPRF